MLEADSKSSVQREVDGRVREGGDDRPDHAEAEEVLALLESEAEAAPQAGGARRVAEAVRVGGAAVDAGVSRDGQLGDEIAAALAEEPAGGEAELQAGEASAGAYLEFE